MKKYLALLLLTISSIAIAQAFRNTAIQTDTISNYAGTGRPTVTYGALSPEGDYTNSGYCFVETGNDTCVTSPSSGVLAVYVDAVIGIKVGQNGITEIRGVPYAWPTSNQSGVLTDDGSGNLSWSASPSIGGSISGGTAGSILFVNPTATIAQNNEQFFWDATNARLGIGTVAPTSSVHVQKDQNAGTIIGVENDDAGASAYSAVEIRNAGTSADALVISATGSGYSPAPSTAIIRSSTNLTGGMQIKADVGPLTAFSNSNEILNADGTTTILKSGGSVLTLDNNGLLERDVATGFNFDVKNTSVSSGGYADLRVFSDVGPLNMSVTGSATSIAPPLIPASAAVINADSSLTGGMTVKTTGASDLRFGVNDTLAMILKSDGKVGIGNNSSPTSSLHIQKDQDATTILGIENDSNGASAAAAVEVRNAGTSADALVLSTMGTGNSPASTAIIHSGSNLSGGIQVNADAGNLVLNSNGGEIVSSDGTTTLVEGTGTTITLENTISILAANASDISFSTSNTEVAKFVGATGKLLLDHNLVVASPDDTMIEMQSVSSGADVMLKTASGGGTWNLTLPPNAGSTSQFLKTDGSGVSTWGDPATAQSPAALGEIFTVTTNADTLCSLNSTYFTFFIGNDTAEYYDWLDCGGLGIDPALPGATGIQVTYVSGDNDAAIATAMQSANALQFVGGGPYVVSVSTNVVTFNGDIGNVTSFGPTTDVADGLASTGFSFAVTQQGDGPTSSQACRAGEVRYDTHFIYSCIATNTWRRASAYAW